MKNSTEFKIGARVRVIADVYPLYFPKGTDGVVMEIGRAGLIEVWPYVTLNPNDDPDSTWPFHSSEIEKIVEVSHDDRF